MIKLLGEYTNGNVKTRIYSDGTKIRTTNDDVFRPIFPENFDCQISTYCRNGCKFCYAGCSESGRDADLLSFTNLWDSVHPYTEIALNLNSDVPKDFIPFLEILKDRKIIANITVNQRQFVSSQGYLLDLVNRGLIHGIGISLDNVDELIQLDVSNKFPNAVIHTIAGVTSPDAYRKLADGRHKVLILGYKTVGRGSDFLLNTWGTYNYKFNWLYENLNELKDKFKVLSFDNLALDKLDVKRLLSEEEWEQFYMGDDGSFTLYVDLVNQTFARNSMTKIRYPMGKKTIDEMFAVIQKEMNENG